MPVDSSIYSQFQAPDILGSVERGMRLGDMIKQRRKDSDIKDAFKAGMVTNPDGTVTRDDKLTLKALLDKGYGNEAWELQEKMQANQIAKQKQDREQQAFKIGEVGRLAGAALQNPNAWMQIRQEAIKSGYGTEESLPQQYDEKFIRGIHAQSLSAQEQLAQMNNERDYKLRQQDMNLKYAQRNDQKSDAKIEREGKRLETDVQSLSKSLAGTQDLVSSVQEVENLLGAPLDEFSVDSNNTLKRGDKKVDLPGVSLPGVGRVSFYDNKARDLAGAVGKVFNVTLKDRSGAAVTNTELERLKNEFGQGKYNSESEMIGALQRYKTALSKELENREAAYRPEVRETYADRGGTTSKQVKKVGEPSQQPDVAQYAKDHGISYQAALNVKNARLGQAKR